MIYDNTISLLLLLTFNIIFQAKFDSYAIAKPWLQDALWMLKC